MKTIHESVSTPKADGYRMPGEFEPQTRIWMAWPHRTDTWAWGAKPAQKQYADVARAIAEFEPVTMCVNQVDYANAKAVFEDDENVTVVEMTTDDAWVRDTGATWVVNDEGDKRAVHWHFNAYGGFENGLYFPWDKDEQIALKMAEMSGCRRYRPESFILEGGSIHVDGEGTVITTDMCLLDPGRNASVTDYEPWSEELRAYCDEQLKKYLGVEKVIWVKDGIDPEETNGHIDDVACFVRPGEVACIWTDDEDNPFYEAAHAAYETLSNATDAKGRQLRVHKLTMPKEPTYMTQEEVDAIDVVEGTIPRTTEDVCIASYMNFLIGNDFVLVPQYDDEYDEKALQQVQEMFPEREVVGVPTREVVYGGGNIHCITQQQPVGV